MTGWQPGGGGQENWNQPFGPDAGTNTYGTDPYANQPYGGNPYGGEPYPYGQPEYGQPEYNQYPQYATGGFPAQGYPPPPPKRTKLPMILSLIAIVIIVGAAVTIVLVNRNGKTAAPPPETTSKSAEKTTGGKSESSSATSKPADPTNGNDDWIAVDNTADAGLSYQVPPDWDTSSRPSASGLDVDFTGNAEYGVYECEGGKYVRTFVASGDVQGKDGADLNLKTTVEDFAKSFATTYYGEDAQIEVGAGKETEIDGKTAIKLTAAVKPTVTKPACQATDGEIALAGVLLENEGKPAGVAMVVVVNDLAGGPSDPKPVDASVSQEILDTVRVS